MNAKQAEQVTGISRRNLRFYEQQGLIRPARNPDNEYREYSQEDIDRLKLIRMLRMLDTPLEEIKAFQCGEKTLRQLTGEQEDRLRRKQAEVEISMQFCKKLQASGDLDPKQIDQLLRQMDDPAVQSGLSADWKNDYRRVAEAEKKKAFSFTPDTAVTTPQEFTMALCRYAQEHELNLVITKEGLAPEFEIDGIAYTAQRIYRRMGPVPVMIVRCTVLHPEALDAEVKGGRGAIMRLLHNWWPILIFGVIWLTRVFAAEKPGEVLLVGAILLTAIVSMYWVFRSYRD